MNYEEKLIEFCKRYRLTKSKEEKIKFMLKIGKELKKNRIKNQKSFWELQEKNSTLTRSLLLRSYWLTFSFSLEESLELVKKYRLSDVFEILPLLAEGSKIDIKSKIKIKKGFLDGTLRYLKEKKHKKGEDKQKIKNFNKTIKEKEIKELYKILKKNKKFSEEIKKTITNLVLLIKPNDMDLVTLNKLIELCKKKEFYGIEEKIKIIKNQWKKTRTNHVFSKIKKIIINKNFECLRIAFGISERANCK